MSDDESDHLSAEDQSDHEGSSGEEEASTASTKGGKKVTAAAAAGAAAGKGKKETKKKPASPAKKRKDADGGAASAAKKPKAAASSSDPKEVVRQYMVQQNRPYTALVVFENLHQQIKKPALIKYMDELTEEGMLQAKDFKKVRVYLAKQDDAAAPDQSELDSLLAKDAVIRESLNGVKSENSKLSEQIRMLQNAPSESELAAQLADYQKRVSTLNARLARIKSEGKQVSKASMNGAQTAFNEAARAWVKRKRAATDMLEAMCGEDGDPKEAIVRFGLETDEDAEVKVAEWKDLIKDVKK